MKDIETTWVIQLHDTAISEIHRLITFEFLQEHEHKEKAQIIETLTEAAERIKKSKEEYLR